MPTILEALRAVYQEAADAPTVDSPKPPSIPQGTVLCRIRLPWPVASAPYDEMVDRPQGYIVVDASGREIARYSRFLERAKHRFDRAGFDATCKLLRLPDRKLIAVRSVTWRSPFVDD